MSKLMKINGSRVKTSLNPITGKPFILGGKDTAPTFIGVDRRQRRVGSYTLKQARTLDGYEVVCGETRVRVSKATAEVMFSQRSMNPGAFAVRCFQLISKAVKA